MKAQPNPLVEVVPQGERTLVTVSLGSKIVFADKCDPGSERSREKLLDRLVERFPGLEQERGRIADRILQAARHSTDEGKSTSLATPHNPQPATEPVDGADLLEEVTKTVARYVVLPTHAAVAVALWIVHTYGYDRWQYSPRLLIHGPEMRCGKSLLLRLVSALVSAPLRCGSTSAAALFRSINAWGPTLLLDEADTFLTGPRANEEIRGIIDEGFESGGAVLRCEGDDHEPTAFRVFGPLAMAMIGTPHGTIVDRSVGIEMSRKKRTDQVEKLPVGKDLRAVFEPLQRKVIRWMADSDEALRRAVPEIPTALHDRAADMWFALLAIAEVAGGTWPQQAKAAAVALQSAAERDAHTDLTLLLSDLRTTFDSEDEPRLATARILDHLNAMEERPWPEYSRGRPLTAHQLAALLRRLKIAPRNCRMKAGVLKGYDRADFEDSWSRYLEGPHPHTT